MSHTFVRLPTGDVEIDHIREMVAEVKDQTFAFSKWHPRPGLKEKKSGFVTHLYTGQAFDENYFTLDKSGWTDDHCLICFKTLGSDPDDYAETEGYFNGYDWVCKTCYKELVLAKDLELKIEEYRHFDK